MKKRYRPVNNLSSQSIDKLQKTGNLKKYLELKQPVDTITLIENVITRCFLQPRLLSRKEVGLAITGFRHFKHNKALRYAYQRAGKLKGSDLISLL